MAETSGLGHAGGGFTPAGTPHYSKYYSYGFYKSRTQPRSMAWAYLLAALAFVPVAMGTFGAAGVTTRSTMSQSVASRWSGKEFAKGFAWEAVPVYGSVRNVVAISRLSGGPYINRAMLSRTGGAIAGQIVWTAAYAYAAKTIASQNVRDQGDSSSTGSRGGSRRRRFEYEYAYKF